MVRGVIHKNRVAVLVTGALLASLLLIHGCRAVSNGTSSVASDANSSIANSEASIIQLHHKVVASATSGHNKVKQLLMLRDDGAIGAILSDQGTLVGWKVTESGVDFREVSEGVRIAASHAATGRLAYVRVNGEVVLLSDSSMLEPEVLRSDLESADVLDLAFSTQGRALGILLHDRRVMKIELASSKWTDESWSDPRQSQEWLDLESARFGPDLDSMVALYRSHSAEMADGYLTYFIIAFDREDAEAEIDFGRTRYIEAACNNHVMTVQEVWSISLFHTPPPSNEVDRVFIVDSGAKSYVTVRPPNVWIRWSESNPVVPTKGRQADELALAWTRSYKVGSAIPYEDKEYIALLCFAVEPASVEEQPSRNILFFFSGGSAMPAAWTAIDNSQPIAGITARGSRIATIHSDGTFRLIELKR